MSSIQIIPGLYRYHAPQSHTARYVSAVFSHVNTLVEFDYNSKRCIEQFLRKEINFIFLLKIQEFFLDDYNKEEGWLIQAICCHRLSKITFWISKRGVSNQSVLDRFVFKI